MNIVVVGLNHKIAPIALRERFAFATDEIETISTDLTSFCAGCETVIISTCNRVEIYIGGLSVHAVTRWLSETTVIAAALDFLRHSYIFEGIAAVEHLMRVACGLDSLVLGEPEILGQVKQAFTQACFYKTVGPHFSRLFRQTFQVAKRVRTHTKIGACPVSVASTAVMFAKEWMATSPRVLILGAGAVGSLVAKYAQALSFHPLRIVSRQLTHAQRVADDVNGIAGSLIQLSEYLSQVDIVIAATSSKTTVIQLDMLRRISHRLLIIDLAVPRDVDPRVGQHPHVTLCSLDQLKVTIQQHVHVRAHAALQAERLIEACAREFLLSLRTLTSEEIIKQYRSAMEAHCAIELQKALKANQRGAVTEVVLQDFSRNLLNKMMHIPCAQLRQASVEGRQDLIVLACELLGVQEAFKL